MKSELIYGDKINDIWKITNVARNKRERLAACQACLTIDKMIHCRKLIGIQKKRTF